MNPQYIHQQQQQQPPFYGEAQNAPPFGEMNANIPQNMLKGSHNPQTYPPQKPMSGPPPSGNMPPPPQASYYENSMKGKFIRKKNITRFMFYYIITLMHDKYIF